jgi:rubredoxin-NAD+ reductase
MSQYRIWECQACGWLYNEEKGCPEEGLRPGTKWEDIPDDWRCPDCGISKRDFQMKQVDDTSKVKHTNTQKVSLPPFHSESPSGITPLASKRSQNNDASGAPIVVIGSGMAGVNFVKSYRQHDKHTPIVVICADDGAIYSKPQLSTAFAQQKSVDALTQSSAIEFSRQFNVRFFTYTLADRVDTQAKHVLLQGGGAQPYDRLVLATGSSAITPSIEGNANHKIRAVNNLRDYGQFVTEAAHARHITIMGAGLIGCEFADNLLRAGLGVSIVDPNPSALYSLLPHEASLSLTQSLAEAGADFHFGTTVSRIENRELGTKVILTNGQRFNSDLVLSAIGVQPNIELALRSDISCQRGILTNSQLATSVQDVFAVGDCAQVSTQRLASGDDASPNNHSDEQIGAVLPYVAPLLNQVKLLASNLANEIIHGKKPAHLSYPIMPITVKTNCHPINMLLPIHTPVGHNRWVVEEQGSDGVGARFLDNKFNTIGYVLTGKYVTNERSNAYITLIPDGN